VPPDSSSSRSPSPSVIPTVSEFIKPDSERNERRSPSRLRTVSASPKSYTHSLDARDSIEEVDLTERPSLSSSYSPVDVLEDSVPMDGSDGDALSPLTYEPDRDGDGATEDIFHSPEYEDFVASEQAVDEPSLQEIEVEVEAIVKDEESVPIEDIPDSASRHVSLVAEEEEEEIHDNDLGEDIVPPTPTPELEDSVNATPEALSRLIPPVHSIDSSAPIDLGYQSDEAMDFDDMEETRSNSSAEGISPRTPSPLSPTPIAISILGTSSRPMIQAPSPIHETTFNLDDTLGNEFSSQASKSPSHNRIYFNPHYTIPPLNSLPPEFHRKKSAKQQRKRDKEKDRGENKKDDWMPLGMNKWRALLRTNPAWKHVAKSSKSLTSKDWNVRFSPDHSYLSALK
jgi:hypothetical protein